MIITRFAPSPNGPLHWGHAYSAIIAHDLAREAGGKFLLRIEDIDGPRSRPELADEFRRDLEWLGLEWDGPVMLQSQRLEIYQAALDRLRDAGLLYPCFCTRKDIAREIAESMGAPHSGPDGPVYPGTCRAKPRPPVMPDGTALRLNVAAALKEIGASGTRLSFRETGTGTTRAISIDMPKLISTVGDIILSRKDFPGSYHLSVVLDDAAQNVTHVIRGTDLFDATQIHVVLQKLFGLATPTYHHHRLIRDAAGKRLAKRDDARAIAKYRADGATPQDIREKVGL